MYVKFDSIFRIKSFIIKTLQFAVLKRCSKFIKAMQIKHLSNGRQYYFIEK